MAIQQQAYFHALGLIPWRRRQSSASIQTKQIYLIINNEHDLSEKAKLLLNNILACINQDLEQVILTTPQQLNQIEEKAIFICLGEECANNLLGSQASLKELRQTTLTYQAKPCFVTHNPQALLQQPILKQDTYQDLKRIHQALFNESNLPS